MAMHQRPIILGHRGGGSAADCPAGACPENTLPAIAYGLSHGADGVEIDVCATADHTIVLSHDGALHGRPIGAFSYAELCAPRPACLPTLEACVALLNQPEYANCILNVELKNHAAGITPRRNYIAAVTTALRQRNNFRTTVMVQSFYQPLRRCMQAHSPALRIGITTQRKPTTAAGIQRLLTQAKTERATILSLEYPALQNPALIAAARSNGLAVHAWATHETLADTRRMAALEVDAIITDYPEQCRALLTATQRARNI